MDRRTAEPVRQAAVEVEGTGRTATTGSEGTFRIRAMEAGRYTLTLSAPGYAEVRQPVEVENGRVTRVRLGLPPRVLEVEGIEVAAERRREVGARRLGRREVEASGARHAAELLEGLPGVAVRSRGPGGSATVSLRGSGADAVLVLVDGVPLNDPVTGEADLSTLPVTLIEEVTVLPGARSARYGPRAQGGVILVETRGPEPGGTGEVTLGSLGRRALDGGAGLRLGVFEVGAGAAWREEENAFPYRNPPEAGGTEGTRENADLRQRSLRVEGAGEVAGGRFRGNVQVEELERGLPGKGFAPSRFARQELGRGRVSTSWSRTRDAGSERFTGAAALQRVRHHDPDPPFGRPYDTRTRLGHLTLRAEGDRRRSRGIGELVLGGGAEVDHQRVDADGLSPEAPGARTDVAVRGSADLRWSRGLGTPEVGAAGRLHRDGLLGETVFTHELTLRASPGPTRLHLAHRSAYSPPTLGDQFFREGVAVEANPDLRAERIPGEWEVGGSAHGRLGPFALDGRLALFRGDVRGMIVWAPDFRFVWSPRNVDVDREGGEVWAEVRHPALGLGATASWSVARVTYDRPDPVQLIYRPRHTGSFEASWDLPGEWTGRRPWEVSLRGRYLGTRYPVAARANALPPFWSFDLTVRGGLDVAGWSVEPALRVDRLLDRRDAFIFAFPEPGRTWRLEVRVRSAEGARTSFERETER